VDLFEHPGAIAGAALACIPIGISLWALLDAARRPEWAWALASRTRVGWMAAILLGTLFLAPGLILSGWYLVKVRPVIAAAEDGRFSGDGQRSRKRRGGGP
jgi:hypothetical protein